MAQKAAKAGNIQKMEQLLLDSSYLNCFFGSAYYTDRGFAQIRQRGYAIHKGNLVNMQSACDQTDLVRLQSEEYRVDRCLEFTRDLQHHASPDYILAEVKGFIEDFRLVGHTGRRN